MATAEGIDLAGLSDREVDLLRDSLITKARSYQRKRSWRPSEIAMAQASVDELARKLGLGSIFKPVASG